MLTLADDESWLLEFELERSGLDEVEGFAVDLDESLASLAVSNGDGGLLSAVDLDALGISSWSRHFFYPVSDLKEIHVKIQFTILKNGKFLRRSSWVKSLKFILSLND